MRLSAVAVSLFAAQFLVLLLTMTAVAEDAGLAKARASYQNYCQVCHGKNGKGDGPGAAALSPKPRDFADCKAMAARPDAELFKAIKNGGPAAGLSAAMPAWSGALSDEQIHEMVKFVRSFCKSS